MTEAPYRLFDYYRYEDRDLFFGRDEEVARIVGDILSTRLLVLFAPSGSGKSSLLRAGVQPALEKRDFDAVFVRVGEDPIASIVTAIETLDSTPTRGAPDLTAALKDRARPVVVFVDQLEELFLQFGEESEKRKSFPVKLAEALFDPSLRVYFVLSLRSEYFVYLNEFREAIPTTFHNNANLELRPFDDASARAAIAGPSERTGSGFSWEPNLPERIVRDLKDRGTNPRENGVLPITLQIVCHTLWSRLPNGLGKITAKSYEAEGGAAAIIERRIFRALNGTPTRDRRLLCRLLRELITKDGTKRIQSVNRLYEALGASQKKRTDALLARFNKDLLLREESSGGETWVELRHDYLAARMKPWLDEEERRLDALRRRNNTVATIACVIVAAVFVRLYTDYHTYSAEIGTAQGKSDPEDELVVTRWSKIWKFRIETGFTRNSLQDGGISHNTFNAPNAPSDWTAIGEHLDKAALSRLVLATQLDSFPSTDSSCAGPPGTSPDFDALGHEDIGYYAAADDRALSFVCTALKKGNAEVKELATLALGRLGANLSASRADAIANALLDALKAPDFNFKSSAADALGNLGANLPASRADAIADALLAVLKDPDPDVKRSAAGALARLEANLPAGIADKFAVALLTALKDPDRNTRSSATLTLGRLGANLPSSLADKFAAALLAALKDPDSDVRISADELGFFGANLPAGLADKFAAALLTALKDPDSNVRSSAADVLGGIGGLPPASRVDAVIASLLTALKDPDSGVRHSAAGALRSLGANLPVDRADVVTAALLAVLKDPDSNVKSSAALALGDLGANLPTSRADVVAAALLAAHKDPDPDVKSSAAYALGHLGISHLPASRVDAVTDALLAALMDPSPDIQRSAADALGHLGISHLPASRADTVAAALLAALMDSDQHIRSSAADALGDLGANLSTSRADAVAAALLATLRDAVPIVRSSAADALGRLGANLPTSRTDAIAAALLATLKDSNQYIRSSAADALGRLGISHLPASRADTVVAALLDALQDSTFDVIGSSADALGKLKAGVSKMQAETAVLRLARRLAESNTTVYRPNSSGIEMARLSIRELTRGDGTPTEKLIQDLESDDSRERTLAIHKLARHTLPSEQLQKIRLLRNDPKGRPWVRMAALETLVEIEREKETQASKNEEAAEKERKSRLVPDRKP